MEEAIFPAVDSGELQETTATMADLLQILTDPVADPHKDTLRALLNLAQTRTILTQDQLLDVVDSVIYDRELKSVTHALAQLAEHLRRRRLRHQFGHRPSQSTTGKPNRRASL